MKKILTSVFISAGLSACSMGSHVNFMDRNDLAEMNGGILDEEFKYESYDVKKQVRKLGAVAVSKNGFNEEEVAEDQNVITINRYRQRVYAETSLFKSENKEKTFFDETMFDFGVDKKTKGVSFNLTFRY